MDSLQTTRAQQLTQLWSRVAEVEAWSRWSWRIDDLETTTRTQRLRRGVPGAGRPLVSAASVEEVARLRAEALRADGMFTASDGVPSEGRLLAFDPGQSLSDGAAASASHRFFDDDNTPPWDCWLLFVEEAPRRPGSWSEFDSYLLCWIPAGIVPVVTPGIDVNPEQCIRWADELGTPFLEELGRTAEARRGGALP